jgi:hypothetical protein
MVATPTYDGASFSSVLEQQNQPDGMWRSSP